MIEKLLLNFCINVIIGTILIQISGSLIPIPGRIASKYHDTRPNLDCFKGELVDLDINKIYDDRKIIPKHFDQCGPGEYHYELESCLFWSQKFHYFFFIYKTIKAISLLFIKCSSDFSKKE
jgi:hypothetical protein